MITMISRSGTGQTFVQNVNTYLTFNTVVQNDLGIESNDANNLGLYQYYFPNDGIQIKFSGLYLIATGISLSDVVISTTLGNYILSLWSNDETFMLEKQWAAHCLNPVNVADTNLMTVSTTVRLFEGDIVRSRFIQTNNRSVTSGVSGGAQQILTNALPTFDAWLSASLIIA